MSAYNSPPDLARSISALSGRVAALERTRTIIYLTADPTGTAPNGAMAINEANGKLWVGWGGGWHFVVTT